MGIILSRVRKKKSTVEILEKLDNDIKEIEENRINAQKKYKKITKLLLIYSVGLYVLCGVIFYFHFTSTFQRKLLYLVPLAISPLLLYIVKKIVSWYFVSLINKNQKRLNEMKKEKKRILDEVMDKETYKVAKEILDKFSKESVVPKPNLNVPVPKVGNQEDGLRKRTTGSMLDMPRAQFPPNINQRAFTGNQTPQLMSSSSAPNRALTATHSPGMLLPAPILPLQRTYIDRVVEYLIGDGPNNRYALICNRCHSHNGMALKEEFEYIGFKCCYCFFYNPARKMRPEAPKLENVSHFNQETDSDSERTSGESSDPEVKSTLVENSVNENVNSTSNGNDDVNPNPPESNLNDSLNEAPEEKLNEPPKAEEAEEAEDHSEETKVLEEQVNLNKPESDASCDESVVSS